MLCVASRSVGLCLDNASGVVRGLTICLFRLQLEQLWQLEHEVAVVALEASEVRQHLDTQTVVLADLEAEIKRYNNTLTADQAKMSSFYVTIRQKQDTISNFKQKINNIVAITGVRGAEKPAERDFIKPPVKKKENKYF